MPVSDRNETGRDLVAVVLTLTVLLWAGMLLGVSFLATPAKFNAPSLTLPVALDVGHHTSAVFAPVEIAMAAIATGLAALTRRKAALVSIIVVDAMVALQTLWLLPALDARVAIIVAGGAVPDSPLHLLYIGLEAAKLLTLMTIGVLLLLGRYAHERQAPMIDVPARSPTGASNRISDHR
jgi:hypothetical protein